MDGHGLYRKLLFCLVKEPKKPRNENVWRRVGIGPYSLTSVLDDGQLRTS